MDCKNSRDDFLRTVTLRVDILQQGKELNQTLLKYMPGEFPVPEPVGGHVLQISGKVDRGNYTISVP